LQAVAVTAEPVAQAVAAVAEQLVVLPKTAEQAAVAVYWFITRRHYD
jgi:hypothetical protein